jgi:hypothetical protein
MRARTEMETTSWQQTEQLEQIQREGIGKDRSMIEIESLLCNLDEKDLLAPLREAKAAIGRADAAKAEVVEKRWAALALQQQWNAWLAQRELLREEIKRGKECLEQVRQELTALHARLEDWPAYERECGKSPLFRFTQALSVNERVQEFLPGWLERREGQLQALTREMEACARQNGLD